MRKSSSDHPLNYGTVPVKDIPKGRRGKHHEIVREILEDLLGLPSGSALKVPLSSFKGQKLVNIRSAVNRATRGRGLKVSTSTDNENFYIWKK